MNAWSKHIILMTTVLLTMGCTRSIIPATSGGRSYEVLVTGADSKAVHALSDALQSLTMSGLPQEEPLFDVSALVKGQLDQGTRYARNIILVSVDSTHLKKTRIRYEQDVYAHPQTIIHVDAPSAARLLSDLSDALNVIADGLVRAEMSHAIVNLRDHHNTEASILVKKLFACRLWIPEDLQLAMQGKDFVWFSNHAARGMQNICMYRYQSDSLRRQQLIHKRDSILTANIKGANDSVRIRTVAESVEFRVRDSRDIHELGVRGLWETEGDAMGGPFVSLALQRGDSIVCVEGFVYAPEMRKRQLIRRMEASLYTLKNEYEPQ